MGKVRTNRWTNKWNMHIAGLSRFDTLSSESSYSESIISPRSNLEVIILDSIGKYHVCLLSKKKIEFYTPLVEGMQSRYEVFRWKVRGRIFFSQNFWPLIKSCSYRRKVKNSFQ